MTAARAYRFFKMIGFRKDITGARNALGYAAFRSESVQEKAALIFDDRTHSADVKSFVDSLDDPVTAHPKVAKAYHALFSLPREAYERGAVAWPDVVRQVLKGYELETGRKLHWVGVVHDDPKHPHAHVVIKATYQDQQGRTRRLRLGKQEIERIKEQVCRALEVRGLEVDRLQPARAPQPRQMDSRQAGLMAAGSVLGWLQQQIKANQRQRAWESEQAHQEWLHEKTRDSGRGR